MLTPIVSLRQLGHSAFFFSFRSYCGTNRTWDLLILSIRFGDCEAANPVDQVYGLFGIVFVRDGTMIDYTIFRADLLAKLLCVASKYNDKLPLHGFAASMSMREGLY